MSTTIRTGTLTNDRNMVTSPSPQAVGEAFLGALTALDFDALERIFTPKVNFRSLVPGSEDFGSTASAAVRWLRDWFGDEETLQVLQSEVYLVQDILSIHYRLRVRAHQGNWQIIEQHAYCEVQGNRIAEMRLICTGFHLEQVPAGEMGSVVRSILAGDLFYDAGAKSCTEGPLEEIARLIRQLDPGQTLEIHATNPSVARDLPAWCRLTGHELINQEMDHFLIRHK